MPSAAIDLTAPLWAVFSAPAAASATAPIAPSDRYGSMALYFFIALIIMLPFAVRRLRRVLADRPAGQTAVGSPVERDDPLDGGGDATEAGLTDLESVVTSIRAGAARLRDRDDAPDDITIVVPRHALIDGREADESVTAMLVRDTVRRSGLEVIVDEAEGGQRRLRCRLAS